MQIDLQRLLNYLLLGLSIVGGVIAGIVAGQLISLEVGQESFSPPTFLPHPMATRQLEEDDFQVILQRNLFNSKAVGGSGQIDLATTDITSQSISQTAILTKKMKLIGAVVADEESLALIKTGSKTGVFKLNEEVSPGVTVVNIGRKMVVLNDHGSRIEILLEKRKGSTAKPVRQANQSTKQQGVVAVDEGRWQVSRSVADNARSNLTSLLKTARMVPQVKNGQTVGFKLIELEKGSLLEQIGLKVGDLVVEINQVKLNSPEKALQIFQQVREANNITLGLIRNGKPKTFEYSFE